MKEREDTDSKLANNFELDVALNYAITHLADKVRNVHTRQTFYYWSLVCGVTDPCVCTIQQYLKYQKYHNYNSNKHCAPKT